MQFTHDGSAVDRTRPFLPCLCSCASLHRHYVIYEPCQEETSRGVKGQQDVRNERLLEEQRRSVGIRSIFRAEAEMLRKTQASSRGRIQC